jgi:hypothetical protein
LGTQRSAQRRADRDPSDPVHRVQHTRRAFPLRDQAMDRAVEPRRPSPLADRFRPAWRIAA